ncbi:tripartite motif-containing protein 2-like [Plakobranchus ocellatus]|uniref:Tripartite motif-containing protein 2-like n=1 Tax=Plakobranchus ocellatus TaxID=259542 RepID=A0AAV4B9U8_9GAST|nr:tripartite motif-containing protein 2-like [Plakobranchus ocellatus]
MASLRQLGEDFFTCPLCLERLTDPRTVPCLHTFCRGCLTQYVSKVAHDWKFSCPVCEVEINGNAQGQKLHSVDQWVDSFVFNTFIATVSKIKAARAAEKACDICRQERVLVEASAWCMECLEMLCEDCHRVHGRSRASRDHKIISIDDLQNESTEKLLRPLARPLTCLTHRGKTVTRVCVDCKMAACETCTLVAHAKCRRLEELDKVSPTLRQDMHEARRRVEACRTASVISSQGLTDQLATLTRSKDASLEEVKALKEKVVQLILKKEEQALSQIESSYARQRGILTKRLRSCDLGHSALGKTCQFLDNLIALGNDVDILKNFDTVVKHINTLEKEQLPLYQQTLSTVLKFTPEKKTSEFLKNTAAIGEVKLAKANSKRTEKQESPDTAEDKAKAVSQAVAGNNRKSLQQKRKDPQAGKVLPSRDTKSAEMAPKPKLIATFSGRENSDTMKTDFRDIVSFADGSIVVMDTQFRNKRLKKFNPRGKLISHIDPGDCPASMALIPDSDLVVSLPTVKELVLLSGAGTLVIKAHISTSKSYFSLAASTDGVIAAVVPLPPDGPCVDLLSFTGEILHSLPLDRGKETVVGMTMQGDITLSYVAVSQQVIRRPTSIECDELDNAYITDVETHKVHKISSSGQYCKALLSGKDGLRNPKVLCRMEEGGVAVAQGNGDIKIFVIPQQP